MRIDLQILNELDGKQVRVVMPRAAISGTLEIIGTEYRVSGGQSNYVNFTKDEVTLVDDLHCKPHDAIIVLRR